MILVDLLMKCFLPISFSRYISLPHLHSKVLDSSSSPVTRWPSVLGWVIYPLRILVSYLSDLLCLPHGDAELIKWDKGVRMLWTGKITEAKWKRVKKKSSQDWPETKWKSDSFAISFLLSLSSLTLLSPTLLWLWTERSSLMEDIMIMDQRQLRFIESGSKGET